MGRRNLVIVELDPTVRRPLYVINVNYQDTQLINVGLAVIPVMRRDTPRRTVPILDSSLKEASQHIKWTFRVRVRVTKLVHGKNTDWNTTWLTTTSITSR